MNLAQFKLEFKSNLSSLYAAEEIDEIFFRLTEHHLQKSRADIVLCYHESLSQQALKDLQTSAKRLTQGEPIQYVMGEVEFAGCKLNVQEGVLIPRPETESLVHWMAKEHPHGGEALDICTGSGCIALGFAKLTQAKTTAWDLSEKALQCATSNAKRNQISVLIERVDVYDFPTVAQSYDIIVSNPPYVLKSEKQTMHTNVLHYEPHEALFVDDENSVVFYNLIADFAAINLKSGGSLYFELNPLTVGKVKQLLKQKGFTDIVVVNDMKGQPRMMRSKKPI